nr:hypothetical protein [uncultured Dyadobacter sp.]
MKGHYLLKWLFLTVLSVGVLHFREAIPTGHCRIEQVATNQSLSEKKAFHFERYKPSENQSVRFAHFKYAQFRRFSILSGKLSSAAAKQPVSSLGPNRIFLQNQHFRSRTLSSDDHSISQS